MGWYKHLKKKTKGLKKMSKDIGRVLAGKETSDVLDNVDKAVDIYNKVETGGASGSAQETATKSRKPRSDKGSKRGSGKKDSDV